MPHLREASGRNGQSELLLQHVRDLRQRYAQVGVQLHDQRDHAGPRLRGADGLDAGSAHARPGSCLTMTESRRPLRPRPE